MRQCVAHQREQIQIPTGPSGHDPYIQIQDKKHLKKVIVARV